MKIWIGLLFRDRFVQGAIRPACVAALASAAAARDGNFLRLLVERVDLRHVVAGVASEFSVAEPLVPEAPGLAPAPLLQERLVLDAHRRGESWVEVRARRPGGREPVANGTVCRRGAEAALRRVAGEAGGVALGRGLERAPLQPEGVLG